MYSLGGGVLSMSVVLLWKTTHHHKYSYKYSIDIFSFCNFISCSVCHVEACKGSVGHALDTRSLMYVPLRKSPRGRKRACLLVCLFACLLVCRLVFIPTTYLIPLPSCSISQPLFVLLPCLGWFRHSPLPASSTPHPTTLRAHELYMPLRRWTLRMRKAELWPERRLVKPFPIPPACHLHNTVTCCPFCAVASPPVPCWVYSSGKASVEISLLYYGEGCCEKLISKANCVYSHGVLILGVSICSLFGAHVDFVCKNGTSHVPTLLLDFNISN